MGSVYSLTLLGEAVKGLVAGRMSLEAPVSLELGGMLSDVTVGFTCSLEALHAGKPVVWVCHALTGNANPEEWWPGLVGKGRFYDPTQWAIVCANVVGSCYGTTGPADGLFASFPEVTVRDMVALHRRLATWLGIGSIHTVIGGSLGGQQAIEWAVQEPDRFGYLACLASNAKHSAWGIAFNEAQRMAILADPTYGLADPAAGRNGLMAARAIAMLSYRSYGVFEQSQTENLDRVPSDYRASTYQRYQGKKLADRFNAYSYVTLSRAMDSHDIGRGRGGVARALAAVTTPTLAVAMSTDGLYVPSEQQAIAAGVAAGRYAEVETIYGHDGFLIETDALASELDQFYTKG